MENGGRFPDQRHACGLMGVRSAKTVVFLDRQWDNQPSAECSWSPVLLGEARCFGQRLLELSVTGDLAGLVEYVGVRELANGEATEEGAPGAAFFRRRVDADESAVPEWPRSYRESLQ